MDNTCTVYNVAYNKQSIYYIVCVFCATCVFYLIKSVLQDLPNNPYLNRLNLTIMRNKLTLIQDSFHMFRSFTLLDLEPEHTRLDLNIHVGPHSFKPRSLEPYPLSRIPLGRIPLGRIPSGRIPLGRIPISRCPLSRVPFSRTSLISPSTRLALCASLVVAVRCF